MGRKIRAKAQIRKGKDKTEKGSRKIKEVSHCKTVSKQDENTK